MKAIFNKIFKKKDQKIKIKKIFHSCFLITYADGTKVLTDPFFGENLPEGFALEEKPAMMKEDIPKINVLLITHEHFDHYNKELVKYFVERDDCIVLAPKNIMLELNLPKVNERTVKVDDELIVSKIKIKVLQAQHPQSFYPVAYLLDYENTKIYFAGDTNNLPKTKFEADIAIMPAGGRFTADLFMFIAMARQLAPKIAIPMHYNTFPIIKTDIDKLKERAEEKLKTTKVVVLENGETFDYDLSN